MKKLLMLFAVLGLFAIGNTNSAFAQEDEDILAMDDTLSIDDMDPVFYEEGETEKGNITTYLIIGGIIVIAAGAFFVSKKKKK